MQRIYFEKWIDLNHELTELLSLSVDESINYKIESVGVRAIGSLIVKGEYNDGKKFHDDVDMDVLATFDKIVMLKITHCLKKKQLMKLKI